MFVDISLEALLPYFEKLNASSTPKWGKMSAQRMIEHLTDTLRIAIGENPQELVIEEEKLPTMLRFLDSDKPMTKEIQVPFATESMSIRNEELELAIDEYIDVWLRFEEMYDETSTVTHSHPYYGPLNGDQWRRLHAKHVTHHLTQFGLIEYPAL